MNLTIKKTKLIARAMSVLMILSTVATTGCEFFTPSQTTENSQKEVINHEPQDLIDGLVAKMQAAGYEEMKAVADLYFDAPYLDWKYNYYVEIIDGQLWLSGVIYDEVTYETDYEFKYDDMMFVEGLQVDTEIYETLQQIKEHKQYYILKSTTSTRYGHQIAVYESGNTYYFLAFSGYGEVVRIHKIMID